MPPISDAYPYAPPMLQYLISGDFVGLIIVAITLVAAISLHEFGHALADELQGDSTARLAGRLTINPMAHLDPFGSLMIVLVGFGWGKPVPISPPNLRNRRFGAALVGIAGPTMNVLLAIASALVARYLNLGVITNPGTVSSFTGRLVFVFLYINVLLALLNLIPIPPLDGSRILSAFLPPSKQHVVYFLDQWGFLILLVAAFFVLPRFLPALATHAELWVLRLVGYQV
jgi:Zn-dependent protease